MTEPEWKNPFNPLPEALLIAILTAGAYWLAFRYEAGYLDGFGLPPYLVEVSLQTTLVVALAISSITWILYSIINFILMYWPKHPAIQEKVFRVLFLLLVPFWHLINYGFRAQDWVIYVSFFIIIAVFELFWPLLVYRDKSTLREKFIADEIAESKVRERGIAGRVYAAFGPAAYGLLILFIFGGTLAHTAGRAKATTQKAFFVFADEPDIAVVRMYRDMIIAIPFDRKTKILQAQLVIRRIGTENLTLRFNADAGPLKPQKNALSALSQNSISEPTH
jgi:hypothetical protein